MFLSLGIVLELLHGFKVEWYLDRDHVTRRHMWTLAHAHGTLLALIHLAFAASIPRLNARDLRWRHIASPCLYSATLTLPAGFFLGGLYIYSGDPGMGILLVPVGGFLLLIAVWLIALAAKKSFVLNQAAAPNRKIPWSQSEPRGECRSGVARPQLLDPGFVNDPGGLMGCREREIAGCCQRTWSHEASSRPERLHSKRLART